MGQWALSNISDIPSRSMRETVLRVVVLGTVYALALGFVVALSPSMGLFSPHATGEVGNVAQAPAEPRH